MKKEKIIGFTLIELLIVLLIIGIGLMAITPWLAQKAQKENKQVVFFNEILLKSFKIAKKEHCPVKITGFLGTSHLLLPNGKRVIIPNDIAVLSANIDNNNQEGLEYHIYIYPDKICDYFVLMLSNNKEIESIPILLVTHIKNNES